MYASEIDKALAEEVEALKKEGRAKAPERIITDYLPADGALGPRYRLKGYDRDFIRMNSNSYLSLSNHPDLIEAADKASRKFGVGPGAVRFIDGTFTPHAELEDRVARFVDKPAAKIFNSAYTSNCGLALAISGGGTYWVGDQLNHNSIIRAMRISNVPSANKRIYPHNDLKALQKNLEELPSDARRVVVIFDGIFSMRGDFAPMDEIISITDQYQDKFPEGILTVVDDSHGIGAYGATGRGTMEHTGASPDVIVGTFGKAFGVNGGFVAGSQALVEAIRQKADTYIYTNSLSPADCAAAVRAIDICDSPEGVARLEGLRARVAQFRGGLDRLGFETVPGPHPVVSVLIRDTQKARALMEYLFGAGVLVVALTFPVVPKGDETIRFQINAAHTEKDVSYVLEALAGFLAASR